MALMMIIVIAICMLSSYPKLNSDSSKLTFLEFHSKKHVQFLHHVRQLNPMI
jgi:hypothetical protein